MVTCSASYFEWGWGPLVTIKSPSGTEVSFPVLLNKPSLELESLISLIQKKSWSMWPIHSVSIDPNLMREMLELEVKTIYKPSTK